MSELFCSILVALLVVAAMRSSISVNCNSWKLMISVNFSLMMISNSHDNCSNDGDESDDGDDGDESDDGDDGGDDDDDDEPSD